MTEREIVVFAVKEDKNYVGDSSIRYNKDKKKFYYVTSPQLANGFDTYTSKDKAQKIMDNLITIAEKIGFKKEFHIEKINFYEVLMSEKDINKDTYPFVYTEIKGVAASAA